MGRTGTVSATPCTVACLMCMSTGSTNRCLLRHSTIPILLLLSSWTATPTLGLVASELQALQQLYSVSGGPYWTPGVCSGWGVGDPCAGGEANHTIAADNGISDSGGTGWGGCIVCDRTNSSVTGLIMFAANLSGPFPDLICAFPMLQKLKIDHSPHLFGAVPECVCRLTALTTIQLGSNALEGQVHPCLGNLSATLATLRISFNRLTGTIPHSLCQLTRLKSLMLFGNQLEGLIPTCIGDIGLNLLFLELVGNRLTGPIPESICRLTSVQNLLLGNNELSGPIPPCIGQLNQLYALSLHNNALTGPLPQSICNMTQMQTLSLGNNPLSPGPIPECTCQWREIQEILVSNSGRTGQLPACLFGPSIPRLGNLSAGGNQLTGPIPTSICTAPFLIILQLEDTLLTGSLPDCMGQLHSLQVLNLNNVPVSGPLPTGLFQLPNLEIFIMSKASLTGGLPQHIDFSLLTSFIGYNVSTNGFFQGRGHPLERLTLLGLVDCGLSGPLPPWIGNGSLPQLTTLALGGNSFSGPLPTFVPGSQLAQFAAPNNRFSGSLEPLQHATLLTKLDLSSNHLTGGIPKWLGALSSGMNEFALENNFVSCDLPANTAVSPSGSLRILSGNVFGNRVLPSGVEARDPGAVSYSGGSSSLTVAGAVFGAALGVSATMMATLYYRTDELPPAPDKANGTWRLQQLLGLALIGSAAACVILLLPIYATGSALLACRYAWEATAGYLVPFRSGGDGGWVVGALLIGGFGLGGVLLPSVLVLGHQRRLVSLSLKDPDWEVDAADGTDDETRDDAADTAMADVEYNLSGGSKRRWVRRVAVPVGILMGVVAVLLVATIGVNMAFVVLQESPSLTATAKTVLQVLFSLIHDIIIHFATPFAVTRVAKDLKSSAPGHVVSITTAIALVNSLVSPMVALLLVSGGCFKDKFFGTEPIVSTAVPVSYCTRLQTTPTGVTTCGDVVTYNIVAPFQERFVFSGERCLSSIITLYTPEFVFIFAVRVALVLLAWWMADKGFPWLLVGTRPARKHFAAFYQKRSKLLACWRKPRQPPQQEENEPQALSVDKEALDVLHSSEPVVQTFNLLSVAVCFGMLSPILALCAGAVWCDLIITGRVLGKPGGGEPDWYMDYPLPMLSLAMLLVVHSLYTIVLLSVSGMGGGGIGIVVVNWIVFSAACWWCHHHPVETEEHDDETEGESRKRGHRLFRPNKTGHTLLEALLHDYS